MWTDSKQYGKVEDATVIMDREDPGKSIFFRKNQTALRYSYLRIDQDARVALASLPSPRATMPITPSPRRTTRSGRAEASASMLAAAVTRVAAADSAAAAADSEAAAEEGAVVLEADAAAAVTGRDIFATFLRLSSLP